MIWDQEGDSLDLGDLQHRPSPTTQVPSGAITLFLVDVSGQVGRVGAVAEMVVAVRDERGERVDSVGRLHDGNFVGLQDRRRDRAQKLSGSVSKEGWCPLQSWRCKRGWELLKVPSDSQGQGRKCPCLLK